MDINSDVIWDRNEKGVRSHVAPVSASPIFFSFLSDSVGSGEIRGARERWIAPGALYSASAGID
jgi:hypothetical protein